VVFQEEAQHPADMLAVWVEQQVVVMEVAGEDQHLPFAEEQVEQQLRRRE